MKSKIFFINNADLKLESTLVEPDTDYSRIVILIHGGPDGEKDGPANLYIDIASLFAEQGVASLRFNFSGCGKSNGHYRDMTISSQTAELQVVLDYLHKNKPNKEIAIIAESYGATIALNNPRKDLISSYVLLWPAIDLLDKTFASFVTEDKLIIAEEKGFIIEEGEEIGRGFLKEVLKVKDLYSEVKKITQPVLLIHGDFDQEVPYQQSKRAYDLLASKNKKLVLVPEGDHCCSKDTEREMIYQEIVNWHSGI